MARIVFGPEKLDVAKFPMMYAPNEVGSWFRLPYQQHEVEVLLAGDDRGPDPQWLELAARVSAQVEKFVVEAKSYLESFMGTPEAGRYGDWSLEWLEFGQGVHAGLRWPFEL